MRWTWGLISFMLALGHLVADSPTASGIGLKPVKGTEPYCKIENIEGKFSARGAVYTSLGKCNFHVQWTQGGPYTSVVVNFKAQGSVGYLNGVPTKDAKETVTIVSSDADHLPVEDRPFGSFTQHWICFRFDKWRDAGGPGCQDTQIFIKGNMDHRSIQRLYVHPLKGTTTQPITTWLSPAQRVILNNQFQAYLAREKGIRQSPATAGQVLQRDNAAIGSAKSAPSEAGSQATLQRRDFQPQSQVGAATGGRQCLADFVWRMAGASDYVCVAPESHQRVLQENATAASRRNPKGGPYGPNTCLKAYVWREAFAGDVVCVTPEVRQLVRQENDLNYSRSTGAGQMMRR